MTMTPDPMRATAERLAREVHDRHALKGGMLPLDRCDRDVRERSVALVLAGLTHRDRAAEREAASKAWDAAVQAVAEFTHDDPRAITYQSLGQYRSALSRHMETVIKHDLARFLAAEFDAGERVTPTCQRCGGELRRTLSMVSIPHTHDECITSLRDAVKRLAEQRGAER